jgi:hypothetical protein
MNNLYVLTPDIKAAVDGHDAIPSTPTTEELKTEYQRTDAAAELAAVEADYPLPALDTLALEYRHTPSGRIMIHRRIDGPDDKVGWAPSTSPFSVLSRLRYADKDDACGLRLAIANMDGRPRVFDINRGALAGMGAEIKAEMFRAGLRTEGKGEQVVIAALKAAEPTDEITVVSRPGWHHLPNLEAPVFATPGGDMIGAPDAMALELATSAQPAKPAKAGCLKGWKDAVTAATQAEGCPHWIIGVAAGFAGPVVALGRLDSCGINLSGLSSSGKSTAQKLAVSVWTSPEVGAGLFQTMRATENSLEALGQQASGSVLVLDDLAHADGKAVSRIIYSVSSGKGKARLTAEATLRQSYSWTTFALLSGECSLEEKVRGDGGQWLAGMAVRFPDIDVTGINRQVDKATLEAIATIDHHHGHAGPEFVRRLVEDGLHRTPDKIRERVRQFARNIAGEQADSSRLRAAVPFALLWAAGELAKRYDLLPADTAIGEAVSWAWDRFLTSSDAVALAPEKQAIANIQQWLLERWGSQVQPTDYFGYTRLRPTSRDVVAWFDDEAVYIPTKYLREAAGGVLKELLIAKVLEERGLLARRENDKRRAIRYVPHVGHIQAYALSRKVFGCTNLAVEPVLTVHQG